MTIYRGPGGTGEAHTDNDVTEVRIVAAEAEGYRDEAAISAANALESANNAAFSASEAATSAAIAEQAVIDTSAAVDAAEASAASALDSKNAAHGYADAALVSKNAAAASASNAATSETNAATSEANALASENAAALSEANAATSETNAATSETNAAASAAAALISENNAASSETNAAASESAAAASASSAASSWDQFDDRYLGAKASDPAVDNDGNALLTGALYWNTTTNEIKIWNGTGWAFFSGLPSQAGNSGKYLSTNGSVPAWSVVPDPQPATPTNDGLVFGDTPTAVPSTSGGWNGSDANLIFDGTFKGGTYAYGAWTSFVDSTVHVGDHIYVTRLGTELYYGVVTGIGTISGPGLIWRYFSVSNPLNQPPFTASSCAIRSPFIVEGGNVSLGYNSGSVGSKNTSIGYGAGSTITTGTNLTVVGYDSEPSSATATNEATLGNSSTTKTRLWGAIAVNDQIGTTGQVLTSNGSGTATWQTPAAAGVSSVTGTAPIASSGGATPAISLNAGYGDTQNPFASKTANFVLAAPNGSAGAPTFRAIVAADIPTLNQNTTGTSSNVTGTVAVANGGTSSTTAQGAINTLSGAVTSGSYLRGNGTNVVMSAIQAADVPTLNQNTTGTAANVTGTVAIANGGTGATTAPNAATNLGLGTGNSPSFTGLTLSGGTANGVAYLNGSKALTSGGALTFDGTSIFGLASASPEFKLGRASGNQPKLSFGPTSSTDFYLQASSATGILRYDAGPSAAWGGIHAWFVDQSEGMRLTSTGLGIGTSSPAYKLDVRGANRILNVAAITGTNGAYQTFSSTAGTFFVGLDSSTASEFGGTAYSANLYHSGNYPMLFWTNGLRQMTLDSSGNLGLGVTPSAWDSNWKAMQFGPGGSMAAYAFDNGVVWGTNFYNNAGWKFKGTGYASQFGALNAGGFAWYNSTASGAAGNAITFTQAMTLDASGNLGIGTSSPSVKLHAAENSSGGAYLRLENTRTTTFDGDYFGQLQFNGNDTDGSGTRASIAALCRGVSGQTDMVFSTAPAGGSNTERARIDSSGNLLVGTTSNAPAGTQSQFVNQWNGGSKWGASFNQTVSSATQYTHINFSTNGTTVGYINANNSITTYNSVSDHRLKTVLGAIADSGSRIDALEPIEYEWKIDGSRTRGFLAHKFQEVYAGSVTGTKDAVDKEGKPVYQAMQAGSSEVIADLVAEIQSLRKRLAAAGI